MIARYLLDTNILSEAQRLRPNVDVMRKLQEHRREIATATLVIHELWFGCSRLPESRKRQRLETYINRVIVPKLTIFDYDLPPSLWHAEERARLTKLGKTPPFVDGQIAAIASVNNLVLVTNNIDDFTDFQELRMESWFNIRENS
jgi:tRNA(fMet)-specific endonuclease VapC